MKKKKKHPSNPHDKGQLLTNKEAAVLARARYYARKRGTVTYVSAHSSVWYRLNRHAATLARWQDVETALFRALSHCERTSILHHGSTLAMLLRLQRWIEDSILISQRKA